MAQTNGHGHVTTYDADALRSAGAGAPSSESERRAYAPPRPAAERPLGDLFQELGEDVRNLVSLEVALAKAELSEKAAQAGRSVAFMAAGGFIIYAGFLAIVFAMIAALANFIPTWLSALIVGIVVALIGYALVRKGMTDLKAGTLAPQQTINSLKENKEWVQNQVR